MSGVWGRLSPLGLDPCLRVEFGVRGAGNSVDWSSILWKVVLETRAFCSFGIDLHFQRDRTLLTGFHDRKFKTAGAGRAKSTYDTKCFIMVIYGFTEIYQVENPVTVTQFSPGTVFSKEKGVKTR